MEKEYCCCFTGHRPEKIGEPEEVIIAALRREIMSAVADGFTTFITGMARGVDIWAGEIVFELKAAGMPLRLIAAVPFDGVERSWEPEWKARFAAVLAGADEVEIICHGYNRGCFQIRNRWMVDRAGRVIAVYNGTAGGTRNTMLYAENNGVEVKNVI